MKAIKVTDLYYIEGAQQKDASTATGLYLKLEDGRLLRHQSTDYVMPFEQPKIDSEARKALEDSL